MKVQVKILTSTRPEALEKLIEAYYQAGYVLQGGVGFDYYRLNYFATMLEIEDKDATIQMLNQ